MVALARGGHSPQPETDRMARGTDTSRATHDFNTAHNDTNHGMADHCLTRCGTNDDVTSNDNLEGGGKGIVEYDEEFRFVEQVDEKEHDS